MQRTVLAVGVLVVFGGTFMGLYRPTDGQTPPPRGPADAVQEAETPRGAPETRPEQRKTEHDRSSGSRPGTPAPSSSALPSQPEEGQGLASISLVIRSTPRSRATFEEIDEGRVTPSRT